MLCYILRYIIFERIFIGYDTWGCQHMKLNISLRSTNPSFFMNCIGIRSCEYVMVMVNVVNDFSIGSDDSMIFCGNTQACYWASFIVGGMKRVTVNCNGDRACESGSIITMNDDGDGTLNVHCVDGWHMCEQLLVNALAIDSVNVTCYKPWNGCSGIQVRYILIVCYSILYIHVSQYYISKGILPNESIHNGSYV